MVCPVCQRVFYLYKGIAGTRTNIACSMRCQGIRARAPIRYCGCGCGTPVHHGKCAAGHWRRRPNCPDNAEDRTRFLLNVPQGAGCQLWTGPVHGNGYGMFTTATGHYRSHRYAWELAHGPIPKGQHVLHDCDVYYPPGDITYRRCCNPEHMHLGDEVMNMAEMLAKGRDYHGERHYNAKLTEESVRESRRLHARGWAYTRIGRRFGVRPQTIRAACDGTTWKHVK